MKKKRLRDEKYGLLNVGTATDSALWFFFPMEVTGSIEWNNEFEGRTLKGDVLFDYKVLILPWAIAKMKSRVPVRLYHPCAAGDSWTSGRCCLSSLIELCFLLTHLDE